MSNLINRDLFRKELSKLESEMGFIRKSDVMSLLNKQPIACDVDKVVEELEKLRDNAHECFCIGHDTEDMTEYNAFDTAVEIVKKMTIEQ